MVLAAGRLAPAGYVASLRESSVVLGALAAGSSSTSGWAGPALGLGAVVTAGLVLLVVWH